MLERHGERLVAWAPNAREALRLFPEAARAVCGRALFKAQLGKMGETARPMTGGLRGVVEVAADHAGNTYRVYYTLKCRGWVHVLYPHRKKSPRGIGLPRPERDLIARRLREVIVQCREAEGGGR